MIVVIADDFTGAAELGGIGIRYGLSCEIHTMVPEHCKADLLIIATNTRSMSAEDASSEIKKILKKLNSFPVEWMYKKIDSILRGHILEEINALSQMLKNNHILLIPANPAFGRIISNGIYFINGQPLHETDLRYDLFGDRNTSEVPNLLGANGKEVVCLLKPDQPFLDHKFVIGDAISTDDLIKWAKKGIADQRVLAGAAEFFDALLQSKGYEIKTSPTYPHSDSKFSLFVCGSASDYSKQYISHAIKERKSKVCEIPEQLFYSNQPSENLIKKWANDIIQSFSHCRRVIAAINKPRVDDTNLSKRLLHYTAKVISLVLRQVDLEELLIEGGATASSIIERLQMNTFIPLQEISPGVVRMDVAGKSLLNLTIKPGSYPWPDKIWNVNTRK